jgi:S1-C subfamily serine protease
MRAALPAGPLVCAALALPALAQDDARVASELERRTQDIKAAATPAVVVVTVTTRVDPVPRLAFPGFVIAPSAAVAEKVEGTGFFLGSRGVLVTTRELVVDAARIEVRLHDGTVRDATMVGLDRPFHLAVLRTTAPAGVDALPHAQRVEACGATIGWFLSRAPSLDVQVASVRAAPEQGASYDRFLFAPISLGRGAAGGPLVGGDGRLLGMAVGSLVAGASAGARAVPPRATLFVRGDDVAEAARQIAATGVVERPMIGVTIQADTNRVDMLMPGSPAEKAGLVEGDAIVGVGTVPVTSYADLSRALLRRRVGERVNVVVERDGVRTTLGVTLAASEPPPAPTTPPIQGAVIEGSTNENGDPVYTFIEIRAGSPSAKAGVLVGDRLLAVDGRCATRFLRRHQVRPAPLPPAKLVVEREGKPLELTLASE